jgi:hypothetical protein
MRTRQRVEQLVAKARVGKGGKVAPLTNEVVVQIILAYHRRVVRVVNQCPTVGYRNVAQGEARELIDRTDLLAKLKGAQP